MLADWYKITILVIWKWKRYLQKIIFCSWTEVYFVKIAAIYGSEVFSTKLYISHSKDIRTSSSSRMRVRTCKLQAQHLLREPPAQRRRARSHRISLVIYWYLHRDVFTFMILIERKLKVCHQIETWNEEVSCEVSFANLTTYFLLHTFVLCHNPILRLLLW